MTEPNVAALNGHLTDHLTSMVFDDLSPIHLSVRIGKDPFFLVEADEAAALAYRAAGIRGSTMRDGTVSMGDGSAEAEPILLARCLLRAGPDKVLPLLANGDVDFRAAVGLPFVKKLPSRVTTPLYKRLKEISRINEPETLEEVDRELTRLNRLREKLVKATAKQEGGVESDPTQAASMATSSSPTG